MHHVSSPDRIRANLWRRVASVVLCANDRSISRRTLGIVPKMRVFASRITSLVAGDTAISFERLNDQELDTPVLGACCAPAADGSIDVVSVEMASCQEAMLTQAARQASATKTTCSMTLESSTPERALLGER